jgi:hypothetical protein
MQLNLELTKAPILYLLYNAGWAPLLLCGGLSFLLQFTKGNYEMPFLEVSKHQFFFL